MATKVLNKLVNICATLSGDITSSLLVDLFYPVGSIYTSMNSTDPSELFGGTWEQITDRFLYCADSSGTTGGSSTITEANLPAHTHTFSGTNASSVLNVLPISNANILTNVSGGGNLSVTSRGGSGTSSCVSLENSTSETCDKLTFNYTPVGTLSSTGSGEEFLPPYITVYAWYRTA